MAKEGKIGVRQLIETYYPQYGGWFIYEPSQCAAIRKTTDEWGILHNMASCSIVIDGVEFRSSETLFQLMRFQDETVVKEVYRRNNKKWAQHYIKEGYCRVDWGAMFLDALKFAMQMKHEQCEEFRNELERSKGLFIVEDETKRKSTSYGVQLKDSGLYEGANLLGRLLMELRDNGKLEYTLPTDAMTFVQYLK